LRVAGFLGLDGPAGTAGGRLDLPPGTCLDPEMPTFRRPLGGRRPPRRAWRWPFRGPGGCLEVGPSTRRRFQPAHPSQKIGRPPSAEVPTAHRYSHIHTWLPALHRLDRDGYRTGGYRRNHFFNFQGLGGFWELLNHPKRSGASPPTFLYGFKAPRSRPDPENDRLSIQKA
jgi:hypothetical protein